MNHCGTWDSIGRRERKLAGFEQYVAIPRGSSIHRNNCRYLVPPPCPHLTHTWPRSNVTNAIYDHYSISMTVCHFVCIVPHPAILFLFCGPLCVLVWPGGWVVNKWEWAMYRWCCEFGLKSAWCRRVCCIVAKAFASRQGQQHCLWGRVARWET